MARSVPGRHGPWRALAKALAVLAVLAALILVATQVLHHPGGKLLVIGDSITDQGASTLHDGLDRDYELTVTGVPGARSDERERDLPNLLPVQPDAVVINLGTNDVMQKRADDDIIRSIDHIGSAFPDPTCVTLVTLNPYMVNFEYPELSKHIADVNRGLVNLAGQRGWKVARWDTEVEQYEKAGAPDGPLTLDSVHPTPMGQSRLEHLIADAVGSC